MHALSWPDELLTAQLPRFRQAGVSVLFLESFSDRQQPILNAYFESPTEANFSKIKAAAAERNAVFSEAEQNLVRTSVANQIRPIGIEMHRPDDRLDVRDDYWVKTISSYLKSNPETTWIAFVGATHLEGGGFYPSYVGVDQKLSAPSLRLESVRPRKEH
ncbi:MAG: hypothetical protein IT290_09845 [Deltaproteobacteria bacterium]|nr:hypothetical protein [Deltaproteobacteria bacterium]